MQNCRDSFASSKVRVKVIRRMSTWPLGRAWGERSQSCGSWRGARFPRNAHARSLRGDKCRSIPQRLYIVLITGILDDARKIQNTDASEELDAERSEDEEEQHEEERQVAHLRQRVHHRLEQPPDAVGHLEQLEHCAIMTRILSRTVLYSIIRWMHKYTYRARCGARGRRGWSWGWWGGRWWSRSPRRRRRPRAAQSAARSRSQARCPRWRARWWAGRAGSICTRRNPILSSTLLYSTESTGQLLYWKCTCTT